MVLFGLSSGTAVSAQITHRCFTIPGSEQDIERRAAELDGELNIGLWQSPSNIVANQSRPCASPSANGLAFAIVPTTIGFTYLSDHPRTRNDGVTWTGRGTTVAISSGLVIELGPLSATLRPTFFAAANGDFEMDTVRTTDRSDFAYPYLKGRIDLPQRFGPDAVSHLDMGQSEMRMRVGSWTMALSHENLWWGPAHQYPILMSSSAGGFPHVDLGTDGPTTTPVGDLEARVFWGRLAESEYFDSNPDNDHRLILGLLLGWQPGFVPGLTVGIARVFYRTWTDTLAFGDFVPVFQSVFKNDLSTPDNPQFQDEADQLLSLYMRWLLPESRFEAYLEWSRNDHNASLRDFFLEPDHSRAFTLGFSKLLGQPEAPTRVLVESATLGRPITQLVRPTPPFYVHSRVRQGYTHGGQILGAPIGPGSNAQLVRVDKWTSWGRLGWYFERIRYNDDEYFIGANWYTGRRFNFHPTEFTIGFSGMVNRQRFGVGFGLAFSRELNRYIRLDNDVSNVTLDLNLTWRPR